MYWYIRRHYLQIDRSESFHVFANSLKTLIDPQSPLPIIVAYTQRLLTPMNEHDGLIERLVVKKITPDSSSQLISQP
jgi:hypothetical protein